MSYAIVGFGKKGQALAHAFARKNIEVTVASRRPPEALAPQARAIGPTVVARSLRDAVEADTIILAVPFGEHREIAKALPRLERSRTFKGVFTRVHPPDVRDPPTLMLYSRCKIDSQLRGCTWCATEYAIIDGLNDMFWLNGWVALRTVAAPPIAGPAGASDEDRAKWLRPRWGAVRGWYFR